MKTKLLMMTIIATLAGALVDAAIIDNVLVIPENPTTLDSIDIDVFATLSSAEVPYSTEVTFVDDTVELDITFSGTGLAVITAWNHTESIGALSVGTYDLIVTTTYTSQSAWDDTYLTSFEVVPEPTTLLLLGLGGLISKRIK